jgi:hypothetical protein
MNKAAFMNLFSLATYGSTSLGFFDQKVVLCMESAARYTGDQVVELQGHFRGLPYRELYRPKNQKSLSGMLAAKQTCEAALHKFERWLAEWKDANPPRTFEEFIKSVKVWSAVHMFHSFTKSKTQSN